MSVLDDVFASLDAMSQTQLLLAFIACTGYAFAQGSLLLPKGRGIAWTAAAVGAIGFAVESPDWMRAAMLLGFAVAGLGGFVALVWLTSWALGFGRSPSAIERGAADPRPVAAAAPSASPRGPTAGDPAHSV